MITSCSVNPREIIPQFSANTRHLTGSQGLTGSGGSSGSVEQHPRVRFTLTGTFARRVLFYNSDEREDEAARRSCSSSPLRRSKTRGKGQRYINRLRSREPEDPTEVLDQVQDPREAHGSRLFTCLSWLPVVVSTITCEKHLNPEFTSRLWAVSRSWCH